MSELSDSSVGKRWYRRILFTVVLLGVLYYIINAGSDLWHFDYRLDWSYVILSFIFTTLAYLMQLFIWIKLADTFGLHAPFLSSANAWSLSQLGKYIPGKAGLVLIRIDIYAGESKRKIAVATGVEFVTCMAAACLLVLIALIFLPELAHVSLRLTAAISAILCLIALYPPILKKLTGWVFRIIKRDPLTELPTYGLLMKLVGANILVGLPYGLGLFFAFRCFYPIGWEYFLMITAVYYAATLAGIAAIFAPAGIGVREGIVFLVLPAFIPNPVVIFATILTRILITAVEIFLAAVFWLSYKFLKRK
ncbi:MAG: hypothetical protein CSYNP_01682 [Syntrophus sp. SKADARSKE-3]|nr:hypothetical protein [Syntrophus sp. SKADARSKE-3]